MELTAIGHIKSPFKEKFGIPRQGALVASSQAEIIFNPPYNQSSYFEGLADFSHIWVIWGFNAANQDREKATVRPPRLGGNQRLGVFASRSPFRPNHLGLTAVKLEELKEVKGKVSLLVQGVDMLDGTPVYDIKPYISEADQVMDSHDGFVDQNQFPKLAVDMPASLLADIDPTVIQTLSDILAHDPRPAYKHNPERIYGLRYDRFNVRFRVRDDQVQVISIEEVLG
ncbi:hypothetical protein AWM75_01825 [Aerococcus urinaehominis]|uniref:Uncharacterized protein n=1 Tax=Aerococcus urinaehominis TaxID=128944 RepID=A0A0X8FK59_9LACT|nr:tRNA (N6-threonylcarbamoyladenosine(37)-N6)-methyltransferase TrmO [Aerococcus urinaehominis]AMB98807.1 hypothetical protein AWM75_01825 [Aerococcus urinaehominis]SDM49566.1 tRNA-Thr(GGU) m(6)t(6)A37 methyltransferase TsaA [Aerococcus urinaehominis]